MLTSSLLSLELPIGASSARLPSMDRRDASFGSPCGLTRSVVAQQVDRYLLLCGVLFPSHGQFESARDACVSRWLVLRACVNDLHVDELHSFVAIDVQGPPAPGPHWQPHPRSGPWRARRRPGPQVQALSSDRQRALMFVGAYFSPERIPALGLDETFELARGECAWHLLLAAHKTSSLRLDGYAAERDSGFASFAPPSGEANAFRLSGLDLLAAPLSH